jgi:hypothetical protein
MNWFCRTFGHKWHTRESKKVDGLEVKSVIIWPYCLRCGEEYPEPEYAYPAIEYEKTAQSQGDAKAFAEEMTE